MSEERGGGEGTSGSAFDAANDLLQAALDEVRGVTSTPRAPSGPSDRPTSQPARAAVVAEPELWAPKSGGPKRSSATRRSRRSAAPPPTAPAAARPEAAAAAAADAATVQPTRRRARRRVVDPGAVDSPTAPGEEFDGLSDLFRPAEPPRRRAAKAAPKDATPVVAAGTAAPAAEPRTDARAQDERGRSSATGMPGAAGTAAAAVGSTTTTSSASAPTAPVARGAPAAPTTSTTTTTPTGPTTPAARRNEPAAAAKAATPRLDPVVAAAGRKEVPPSSSYAPARPRTKQLVAALVVAVLIVGAIGIALTSGGGSDGRDTALDTPPGSRLTFPATTTPEGAEMTRVWDLRGASGDRFVGRLQFENPTASALSVTHTETIPKSLASSVQQIRFDPQPVVVNPDPVVRYSLPIAPGGSTTVRYFIDVRPLGADRDRLEAWADDLPTTATSTTTTPRTTITAPVTTPLPSVAGSNRTGGGGGGNTGGGRQSSSGPAGGSGAAPNNPGAPAPGNPDPPAPTSPPATTPPPTVPPTTSPPTAPPQKGSLVIWMRSKDGTGQFSFSTPFGNVVLDTGPGDGEASTGFSVDVGKYPVALQVPDGWTFVGISCNAGGSASGTTATYDITPGAAVRCTFTVRR